MAGLPWPLDDERWCKPVCCSPLSPARARASVSVHGFGGCPCVVMLFGMLLGGNGILSSGQGSCQRALYCVCAIDARGFEIFLSSAAARVRNVCSACGWCGAPPNHSPDVLAVYRFVFLLHVCRYISVRRRRHEVCVFVDVQRSANSLDVSTGMTRYLSLDFLLCDALFFVYVVQDFCRVALSGGGVK